MEQQLNTVAKNDDVFCKIVCLYNLFHLLQLLEEKVRKIEDALTCHVCMDNDINCAFCPCGHVVCCLLCANKLDTCPLCRSDVEKTQQIYLPNLRVTDSELTVELVSS